MPILEGPHTAEDDGEIVVFMIGMTINKPWKVRSWWPVFTAMPKMLRELATTPELGLLSSRLVLGSRGPTVIQYWRSVELLEAFARGKDHTHLPAWSAFMKALPRLGTDVGIWHETFVTEPGKRESLYYSTPRFGFNQAAATYRPAGAGDETAAKRRSHGAGETPPSTRAA